MESQVPSALEEKLRNLLGRETILVRKHTKKGDKDVDIKPDFQGVQINSCPDGAFAPAAPAPAAWEAAPIPALLLEALKQYEEKSHTAPSLAKRLLLKDFSEIQ